MVVGSFVGTKFEKMTVAQDVLKCLRPIARPRDMQIPGLSKVESILSDVLGLRYKTNPNLPFSSFSTKLKSLYQKTVYFEYMDEI
jgi:hypothetical protein